MKLKTLLILNIFFLNNISCSEDLNSSELIAHTIELKKNEKNKIEEEISLIELSLVLSMHTMKQENKKQLQITELKKLVFQLEKEILELSKNIQRK